MPLVAIGQTFNYATTTAQAQAYFYSLILDIITARNFAMIADQFCKAQQIDNFLLALNDSNILTAHQQKIMLGLNNIVMPFNSSFYPTLSP